MVAGLVCLAWRELVGGDGIGGDECDGRGGTGQDRARQRLLGVDGGMDVVGGKMTRMKKGGEQMRKKEGFLPQLLRFYFLLLLLGSGVLQLLFIIINLPLRAGLCLTGCCYLILLMIGGGPGWRPLSRDRRG